MADTDYSKEIWKVIPFAPNYAASDFGRVKRIAAGCKQGRSSTNVGRVLNPVLYSRGYHIVSLFDGGVRTRWQLHRLIATVFHGPAPSQNHQAAHIDGNRVNNRADNLRWATVVENHADKRKHGTLPMGENVHTAKLTVADIEKIRAMPGLYKEIAAVYGIDRAHVGHIKRRTVWKHIP